jgi:hypothetical protein
MSDSLRTGAPPMQHPDPINGATHATLTKQMSGSAIDVSRQPVRIVVDGRAIAPGPQTAQALALLGIDEAAVDDNWYAFVLEHVGAIDTEWYALDHQEGMGWRIEVSITADGVTEVRDLAYVDPRTADRSVTYTARQWDPPVPSPGLLANDPNAPRTSHVVSRTEPLEASGAVGAFYSGISDEDIDSTRAATMAVEGARADLERALQEIDVASVVADAAWQGLRAEMTKYKFGLEGEVIDSITEITRTWETFAHELVEQQRQAQEHDEALQRELLAELAITIVAGALTWGFGAAVSAGIFAARLARWAHEIELLRTVLSSRFAERLTAVGRTAAAGHGVRILARTAGDLSTRAVVGAVNGKPLDGEAILLSFVFAAGVGHLTSEAAGSILKRIEANRGVKFSVAGFGAQKGAGQGAMRAGVSAGTNSAGLTDTALAAPFALGIPVEMGKHATGERLKSGLVRMLNDEPGVRAAAEQRLEERGRALVNPTSPAELAFNKQRVDAEIKAEADRQIKPVLDYLFGAGGRAVAGAGTALTTPQPGGPPLPTTGGTVPQRTGS